MHQSLSMKVIKEQTVQGGAPDTNFRTRVPPNFCIRLQIWGTDLETKSVKNKNCKKLKAYFQFCFEADSNKKQNKKIKCKGVLRLTIAQPV